MSTDPSWIVEYGTSGEEHDAEWTSFLWNFKMITYPDVEVNKCVAHESNCWDGEEMRDLGVSAQEFEDNFAFILNWRAVWHTVCRTGGISSWNANRLKEAGLFDVDAYDALLNGGTALQGDCDIERDFRDTWRNVKRGLHDIGQKKQKAASGRAPTPCEGDDCLARGRVVGHRRRAQEQAAVARVEG